MHTEGTAAKVYFPFVYGYKPRGWNWVRSQYEIHAIIRYDGTAVGSPPLPYTLISHKHYKLSGMVASGGNSSLSRGLEETFNKKLDSWREYEFSKAKAWYQSRGRELETFKFRILALRCYRMGSSEKKEPAMISTLMRANIRDYVSKEKSTYTRRLKREQSERDIQTQLGED